MGTGNDPPLRQAIVHAEGHRIEQCQRLPLNRPGEQPNLRPAVSHPKTEGSEAMYIGIGGLILLIIILYIIFR
jgi:hypothetical protein